MSTTIASNTEPSAVWCLARRLIRNRLGIDPHSRCKCTRISFFLFSGKKGGLVEGRGEDRWEGVVEGCGGGVGGHKRYFWPVS